MKKELITEIKRIAYNCRKATFLIERKQEVALTAREKLELKFHLAGCYICRVYEQQSLLINRLIRHAGEREIKLDNAFKISLQQKIDAQRRTQRT